jgi:hypothetical protein
MAQRVGTFFFFVGVFLVALFILTDVSEKPQFGYFAFGVVAVLVGVGMWWRAPAAPQPPPSGRFGIFQRLKKGAKKAPAAPPPPPKKK